MNFTKFRGVLTMYSAIFLTFILFGCASTKSYLGYHMISFRPDTKDDLFNSRSLAHQYENEVVTLNEGHHLGDKVTWLVTGKAYPEVVSQLLSYGLHSHLITDNFQSTIDEERRDMESKKYRRAIDRFGFSLNHYNRHDEINHYLTHLGKTCSFCHVFSIGKSYEGRDMLAVKIGLGRNRPAIWIDAGLHAREWIAPATALYFIHALVTRIRGFHDLLTYFDWYILPVANPDGYEYTFTTDRIWRKTRSHNDDPECIGTDPNRNWNFHWGEVGASSNSCSPVYQGSTPFSEVECRNIARFVLQHRHQIKLFLTIHSYGQYWLLPWGYTNKLPRDYRDLKTLGDVAARAMFQKYGKQYTVGNTPHVLYAAAGGSDDWAKGVAGIKYSYTVELRDTGSHGFNLPSEQISDQGEELLAGVTSAARLLKHELKMENNGHKSAK